MKLGLSLGDGSEFTMKKIGKVLGGKLLHSAYTLFYYSAYSMFLSTSKRGEWEKQE